MAGLSLDEADTTIEQLKFAILNGSKEEAIQHVERLAQQKVALVIERDGEAYRRDKRVSVDIYIEDIDMSSTIPFVWELTVSTKVRELKRKMKEKLQFPTDIQQWIISKRIADDDDSLSYCGITEDGHSIFVYMMKKQVNDDDQNESINKTPPTKSSEHQLHLSLPHIPNQISMNSPTPISSQAHDAPLSFPQVVADQSQVQAPGAEAGAESKLVYDSDSMQYIKMAVDNSP